MNAVAIISRKIVTPSSQIVGTQAVLNVLMGRYAVLTGEFADLMLGYYGKGPGEKNPEVVEMAHRHAGKQPITCRRTLSGSHAPRSRPPH